MNLKEYLLKLKEKITSKQEKKDLTSDDIEEIIEEEMVLEPKSDEELNAILEDAIKNLFPKDGLWFSCCFTKSDTYEFRFLPCHLRDNNWLAKTIQAHNNLKYISYDKILNFINNSELFNELRHNYELEIVRWQIDWMINDGEGWIVDMEMGGSYYIRTEVCDIAFRKGIVATLSAIGMNKEVIEEGIEKNAGMWREFFMNKAFKNKFDDFFYFFEGPSEEHKKNWLKYRKYEYYCDHKKSVDLYGLSQNYNDLSEAIQMTPEEVKELKKVLEKQNKDRLDYIEKNKNTFAPKRLFKGH